MFLRSHVLKPDVETVTVYVAGRMEGKLKNPLLFDTVSRVTLVS
jgi:hypothetical protein